MPTITPTTTPAVTSSALAVPTSPGRVRLLDVIRGEFLKFRSVRSNRATLVGAALATVLLGMVFSWAAGGDAGTAPAGPPGQVPGADPVSLALGALGVSQILVGVLGVLVAAGEFSTGIIRTTIAAVGSRTKVLLAKVLTVSGLTAVVMFVGVVLAVVLGQGVYAGDAATLSLDDPDVVRVVLGSTVYVTAVAVMGVALGFLLRSTAGAIGTLIGGLTIGPGLLRLLPDSFTDATLKYLPSEAGSVLTTITPNPELLSSEGAHLTLAVWVVGLVAIAAWQLRRNDV